MILGILTAIAFGLVSAVFFTGKLKNTSKVRKLFSAIHKPIGYFLVALLLAHLALTLKLINQRPIIIYVLGITMALCAIASIITWKCVKNKQKAFKWHKIFALFIAMILVAHIVFCLTSFSEYKREVAAITFSDIDVSAVENGEYTGECDVNYIYAKVRVSVSDGRITNIDLLEHRNERGAAGEGVIDGIISEQIVDVDAVSSATNSSKVIKKAVENALIAALNK